jgi:serine/threonine protein kinase
MQAFLVSSYLIWRLEMCLQTEIRALEVLHHPNIVRLEEWFCVGMTNFTKSFNPFGRYVFNFRVGRVVYLCMEMIEGGNLLEAILAKRGLEEERAKEIFFQLCSAVSYCHDKNVLVFFLDATLSHYFNYFYR